MPKEKRGGKRKGAGRKAGPARIAITVRIRAEAHANLKKRIVQNGSSQAAEIENALLTPPTEPTAKAIRWATG